jgi:hypothetical protein
MIVLRIIFLSILLSLAVNKQNYVRGQKSKGKLYSKNKNYFVKKYFLVLIKIY